MKRFDVGKNVYCYDLNAGLLAYFVKSRQRVKGAYYLYELKTVQYMDYFREEYTLYFLQIKRYEDLHFLYRLDKDCNVSTYYPYKNNKFYPSAKEAIKSFNAYMVKKTKNCLEIASINFEEAKKDHEAACLRYEEIINGK